jgi:uncharacterized protein
MSQRRWTCCAAFPLILCAFLVSCSTPAGPPPPDEANATTKVPTEVPTEVPSARPSTGGATQGSATEPQITLNGPGQLLPITATAEIKGQTFQLEVAQTPQQQALGLMFRSALPANRGMLFPFERPRRTSFWMKDVPVGLDMVFLRSGRVVAIAQAPPCASEPCPTYGPADQLVDQVLELRSGRAAELGLQVGDTVAVTMTAQ